MRTLVDFFSACCALFMIGGVVFLTGIGSAPLRGLHVDPKFTSLWGAPEKPLACDVGIELHLVIGEGPYGNYSFLSEKCTSTPDSYLIDGNYVQFPSREAAYQTLKRLMRLFTQLRRVSSGEWNFGKDNIECRVKL